MGGDFPAGLGAGKDHAGDVRHGKDGASDDGLKDAHDGRRRRGSGVGRVVARGRGWIVIASLFYFSMIFFVWRSFCWKMK